MNENSIQKIASLKIPIRIDASDQIFTTLTAVHKKMSVDVYFKIDNGCNAVIIRRNTLKSLGFDTSPQALGKLPEVNAKLADGRAVNFRQVGEIVLIHGNCRICSVPVICHLTRQTNDLLGTSVLHKFASYMINTRGKTFLTLTSN
jgi:hypothetical protein